MFLNGADPRLRGYEPNPAEYEPVAAGDLAVGDVVWGAAGSPEHPEDARIEWIVLSGDVDVQITYVPLEGRATPPFVVPANYTAWRRRA